MKSLSSLLVILLVFVGCSSQNQVTDSISSKTEKSGVNNIIVSFEQTACYGTCPVHKMVIFERGNASYHGDRNTKFSGDYIGSISPEKLKAIMNMANEINFFALEAKYTAPMTDLPTTVIYIQNGNEKHQVTAYAEYPKELSDFIEFLFNISQEVDWHKNM
jgi:hypothetical protein